MAFWNQDDRRQKIRQRLEGLYGKLRRTVFQDPPPGSRPLGGKVGTGADFSGEAGKGGFAWIDRGRTDAKKEKGRSMGDKNSPEDEDHKAATASGGRGALKPAAEDHGSRRLNHLVIFPELRKDGDFLPAWRGVPALTQQHRLQLKQELSLFLSANLDDPFADPRNIDSVLLPLLWHLGETLEVPPTAAIHADCFGYGHLFYFTRKSFPQSLGK
eukprot:g12448.t1